MVTAEIPCPRLQGCVSFLRYSHSIVLGGFELTS